MPTSEFNNQWYFPENKTEFMQQPQGPEDNLDVNLHNISKSLMETDIATIKSPNRVQIIKGQNDIGANTSVTNIKSSIYLYQEIQPYPVNGVHKDDPANKYECKGFLTWR